VLPKTVLYYGKDEPPPERRALRAGPLSLVYEDGDLRYIRLDDREIVRRLYVAVRDHNWGTVPAVLSNVRIEAGDDTFEITYDAEHRQGPIDFFWHAEISGDATGQITFTMDGVARSTFRRNRIGFCVLHPIAECAGEPCVVEHADGSVEQGAFPRYIAPHQPFEEMQAIEYGILPSRDREGAFLPSRDREGAFLPATHSTQQPEHVPLAYLITFNCYGARLHGDDSGSVDRDHNLPGTLYIPSDAERLRSVSVQERMNQPPYHLDGQRRLSVLETLQRVCIRRGWTLLALHVRSNHVHAVVHANIQPERVMNDFKAYASRALNQAGIDEPGRKRWTRHGSTRYLWTPEHVEAAIEYVVRQQGEPMEVMESRERSLTVAARMVTARVEFAGDIFEMEDQRNWTDASFKTFCTPLRLPYPVEVAAGTTVRQSVTLTLRGDAPDRSAEQSGSSLTFTVDQGAGRPIPSLGLQLASHGQPLSAREIERLKALQLAYLRAELQLGQPDYPAVLRQANAEARALGVVLDLALLLSDAAPEELQALARTLEEVQPIVRTFWIFHIGEKSTSRRWVDLARDHLAGYAPALDFGAGTNAYFTELNRNRPPVDALEAVTYSINPQVHAFDNASLVENLAAQASTVESVRQFCANLPLTVGPISLRPRFNPDATSAEPEAALDTLPSQVDPRQMSLFGAGWTLGSLKYLGESGVESATYYETTGWRGTMELEGGPPQSDLFPALPGAVFPLYHVLADVGEFAGGEVIPSTSSDPLAVEGLTLRKDGRRRILLANLGPDPRHVTLHGAGERVRLRILDETSAEEAMLEPERFREEQGAERRAIDGKLEVDLLPFAIARIDEIEPS
jgi:REP element-mobilizing transposase RayT